MVVIIVWVGEKRVCTDVASSTFGPILNAGIRRLTRFIELSTFCGRISPDDAVPDRAAAAIERAAARG
jgi:hypothetical protein